eukprot:5612153-Amphidinium_carterae.1
MSSLRQKECVVPNVVLSIFVIRHCTLGNVCLLGIHSDHLITNVMVTPSYYMIVKAAKMQQQWGVQSAGAHFELNIVTVCA